MTKKQRRRLERDLKLSTAMMQLKGSERVIAPRLKRISDLQGTLTKSSSDEDRRFVGSSILRERLAATEELRQARQAEFQAMSSATATPIGGRAVTSPRNTLRQAYTGEYSPLNPDPEATELPSLRRIHELDTELRKSTDPLERERLGFELTYERLRSAHAAGRI